MSALTLAGLDAVAKDVQEAQQAAMVAENLSTPGQAADEAQARLVPVYAKKAMDSCVSALDRLEAMGAQLVGLNGETAREIPLAQFDTPQTRRLLALLEEAQAVAEEVDAARGRALPAGIELQPGESRGTDLSESLSYLTMRVRDEVHGTLGRE